ncbi:DUF2516 family protein [Streptomyces sp. NPDC046203]|uniref:DUF2516 family protein n=1 Tax=Streptomyces sp. NPDC046203 TaxID=3154602 RepID=UPI003411E060
MLMDHFNSALWDVIRYVLLGMAVIALVFAALGREDAYRAADKKTKKFWLLLLGGNLAVNLVGAWVLGPMFMMFQIAGLVAAIVFMVDVRPALRDVTGGGGRRGGGSSSDGPYGPYNGGR